MPTRNGTETGTGPAFFDKEGKKYNGYDRKERLPNSEPLVTERNHDGNPATFAPKKPAKAPRPIPPGTASKALRF